MVKTKKKDETYFLLVREINRINQVLCQQDHAVKDLIYRLVKKMSKGMIKNTGDYKEKKENITDKKILHQTYMILQQYKDKIIELERKITQSSETSPFLKAFFKKLEISLPIEPNNIKQVLLMSSMG